MRRLRSIIIWCFVLLISIALSLFWDIGGLHDTLTRTILWQVRVPKVAEAMLAGMGLTLAGQLFQILLNNPLADSFTLGLASGATFGSGLAVAVGVSFIFIPIFSMTSSLLTLVLVLLLTRLITYGHPNRILILAGIMIGALFNAFLYIVVILNETKTSNIVNYMFGGFSQAEYTKVSYIGVVLILGITMVRLLLPQLKLLQLDDRHAISLGLKVKRVTYLTLIIASIITAVIVAYVGIIGFIGMVVPQLIRRFYTQSSLGFQIVLNLLVGGSVMVLADWLGTTVIYPVQIPASIILALFSIPVLFYLMIVSERSNRYRV
ncbi:iron ABC transporter permease [Staphylococcus sp. SQ8-PEA]|uniref:Iron ABC transporter permease n=1 Tax=Staphylococcus marylandisciuri TaxID=2981529 RepID=A0ABT2QSB9_9STAP|nr:iron ABC transporter permease [Staphylococcus marylandisciuri]MCU5746886.1 iron ABC transporter permease [Staphylococcus marylandisciuri]